MADEIKRILVEYEENTQALDEVTRKLSVLAKEAGVSEEALDGVNESLGKQVDSAKKVEQQQRKLKSTLSSLYKEYERLERASKSANDEESLRHYQSQLDKTKSKISRLTNELKKLDKEGAKAASGLGKAFSGVGAGLKDVLKFAAGNLLAGGIQGIVTSVASTLGNQIRSGIGDAIDFEQTNIAFETFLGSAEEAKELINDLVEFSDVTPFQTDSVVAAGKQLLAFGIESDKVVDSLKSLGDIAAGTNTDLGDLAFVYGQIRTQQTAYTEDLNQFASRGIPIFEALASQLGILESDVKKFASTGKIQFEDIEKAFQDMTSEGGKFFDLTAKQSESLGGKISTLQGKYATLRREVVEDLLPAISSLVDFLTETISGTNELGKEIRITNEAYNEYAILIGKVVEGLEYLDDNLNVTRIGVERILKELGFLNDEVSVAQTRWQKLIDILGDFSNPTTFARGLGRILGIARKEIEETNEETQELINLLDAEALKRPDPVPPVNQEFILSAQTAKKAVKELTEAKEELVKATLPAVSAFESAAEQIDAAFSIERIDAVEKFSESLSKAFSPDTLERIAEGFLNESLEAEIGYLEQLKGVYEQYGQDVMAIDEMIAERRRELNNELLTLSQNTFSQITDLLVTNNELQADARIASLEKQRDAEIEAAGDNSEARVRIEEEYRSKIDQIQREAARKNQELALIQTIIAQAVAVAEAFKQLGPIAGGIASIGVVATIAKQISVIKAQKFATGVFDLDGPGTSTSDSIPAWLSKGETVVTAEDTVNNWDLLKGIVEDKRPLHKIPLPGGGMGYSFDARYSPANTRLARGKGASTIGIDYKLLGKEVAKAIGHENWNPNSAFFQLLRFVQDNVS